MHSFKLQIYLLAVIALGVTACGVAETKRDAEQVVQQYYESMRTGSFDTALTFYHDDFFEQTADTTWAKILRRVHEKLGDLETFSQTGWHVGRSTGEGTVVQLAYAVTYSKYGATEQFVLKRGETDGDFEIIGHHISSEGLLLE